VMKKDIKIIISIFIIISLIKALFTLFTSAPTAFSDNYVFLKSAWSFFHTGSFIIYGSFFPTSIIYPFVISWSFIFNDMNVVFLVIRAINAFISTLVVIPIYFLAREFLNRKKSLTITVLSALITPFFLFPNYIMAENLYYPLFAFCILFLYFAFKKQSSWLFLFSGLLIGLTILTKSLGYAFIPVCFFMFLFFRKKWYNLLFHYAGIALVFIPFQLRRMSLGPDVLGYSNASTVGKLIKNLTVNFPSFVNWHINYMGYVLLAIGLFFAIYFIALLFTKKDEKLRILFYLTLIVGFFSIFIASNHSSVTYIINHNSPFVWFTGRPLGRYIASIFPFVMLLGFIGYKKDLVSVRNLKIATIISAVILFISTQLTLASLFPLNNSSLSFLGAFQYGIEYILYDKTALIPWFYWGSFVLIGILLFLVPFLLFKLRKNRFIVPLIFLFLIMNFILSFGAHLWNVDNYWENNDQVILGKWIDENIAEDKIILIDTNDCDWKNKADLNTYLCPEDGTRSSVLAMWVSNPVVLEGKHDYVVTIADMDLELVKEVGNFKLYK